MRVKRGDIVESEFGIGPVLAITKEWIIHKAGKSEACLYIPDGGVWVPAEFGGEDVDETATAEIPKESEL